MANKRNAIPMPYHEPQRISIEKAANGLVVHHHATGKMHVAKNKSDAMKIAGKLLK